VLYDGVARRFIIRADRQLHHPEFLRLIADCFCIEIAATTVLSDDHYRSVQLISAPQA